MSEALLLAVPLLALPVVLFFAFAGCVGDDPELVAAKEKAEREAADAGKKVAEQEAAKAAAKYDYKISHEANLVSWWRLDEGQPETGDPRAADSAPVTPLDGQYKNLQSMRRGEKGAVNVDKNTAVEFLGTDGYVEVPFNALRNPPLSFSVELWLLPALQTVDTLAQTLVASCETNPAGDVVRGFALDILYDSPLRVRARLGNEGTPVTLEAGLGDGLQFGGWRHVVMTYDGAAKQLQLYVNADDGKADGTLPTPAIPAPVEYKPNGTMPLRIAADVRAAPVPGSPGAYFKGRIDEVALYRIALPGPSVREHFLAATA